MIAVDPRSFYRKFRDVKAHLERVLLTPSRAYTTWRARGGSFRRAYLTVNGCPSRVLAILRMIGEIAARSGRRAERTPADSDRADRLKPNIVFLNRDSFQRRGHLTVCKVAFYRLTLPRKDSARPKFNLGSSIWPPSCRPEHTVNNPVGASESPKSGRHC